MAELESVYYVRVQGESVKVVLRADAGRASLEIGGRLYELTGTYVPGAALQALTLNGLPVAFKAVAENGRLTLSRRGRAVVTRALTELEHRLYERIPPRPAALAGNAVRSPMAGKVLAVNVAAGQAVKHGEILCIIEAMKMENALPAERDAVIGRLHVTPGQTVDADQLLFEYSAAESTA